VSRSRFKTTRSSAGGVYQAGLDVRTRGEPRPFETTRGPYRGVVIETYVTGSENRSESAFSVEADVVLVRSGARLSRVPVLSRWGVNDAAPWVPRKTTRTLSGDPLNVDGTITRRGRFVELASVLSDLDGDVVLVDYIEGDFRFPVVTGAYPHPHSHREVIEGDGWAEAEGGSERGTPHDKESFFRFAGAEVRINSAGDVLLDTVGATSDRVDEDPAEGQGQVRIRVKSSKRLTVEMDGTDVLEVWKDAGQVRIDLGEDATQRLVLGDDNKGAFDNFRTALTTWVALVKTGIEAGGGTLVNTAFEMAITQLGVDMGNALSDLVKAKK